MGMGGDVKFQNLLAAANAATVEAAAMAAEEEAAAETSDVEASETAGAAEGAAAAASEAAAAASEEDASVRAEAVDESAAAVAAEADDPVEGGTPAQAAVAAPARSSRNAVPQWPARNPYARAAARARPKLTVSKALGYLEYIKEHRADDYDEFMNICRQYQRAGLDVVSVILRVAQLFENNVELMLGFSNFLPLHFEIVQRENESQEMVLGYTVPGGTFYAFQ